jgi:hypothetical protein
MRSTRHPQLGLSQTSDIRRALASRRVTRPQLPHPTDLGHDQLAAERMGLPMPPTTCRPSGVAFVTSFVTRTPSTNAPRRCLSGRFHDSRRLESTSVGVDGDFPKPSVARSNPAEARSAPAAGSSPDIAASLARQRFPEPNRRPDGRADRAVRSDRRRDDCHVHHARAHIRRPRRDARGRRGEQDGGSTLKRTNASASCATSLSAVSWGVNID